MYYSKQHDIYVNGGIRGRGKLDEVFALLSLAFVDGHLYLVVYFLLLYISLLAST